MKEKGDHVAWLQSSKEKEVQCFLILQRMFWKQNENYIMYLIQWNENIWTSCFWHIFLQQNLYSRVPTCQMTTFYYVGFAYLMMRRYQDAIRTFSNILLYIQRTKQMFQSRTQLYDQVILLVYSFYVLCNAGVKGPLQVNFVLYLHICTWCGHVKINEGQLFRWRRKKGKCHSHMLLCLHCIFFFFFCAFVCRTFWSWLVLEMCIISIIIEGGNIAEQLEHHHARLSAHTRWFCIQVHAPVALAGCKLISRRVGEGKKRGDMAPSLQGEKNVSPL